MTALVDTPPADTRPGERPLSLPEHEELAATRLDPRVWDFIAGGSRTESTVTANQAPLDHWWLRPRVLTGVSTADTSTTLLGDPVRLPVGIAPVAYHRLAHPDGEVATARAAGAEGALLTVSIFASRTLEEIAAAATGPLWLQLYAMRDPAVLRDLAQRAEDAGYRALVLTVDAPRIARRLRDARNDFRIPPDVRAVNLDPALMTTSHTAVAGASAVERHAAQQFAPRLDWDQLARLRARTRLPVLLKGVLTEEDTRLAFDHGAAGVVVSNHGGRQLDGAVPSLVALPAVARAAAGRGPVLVDGGIRHGADVLKALALGADAVLVGRPALWGLANGGSTGVAQVLRLLREELEEAMVLTGRADLPAVDASLLTPAAPTRPTSTPQRSWPC
jgi:4-hydroxymandelate oxidase